MIEIAVSLIGVAVVLDLWLVALTDVRHDRRRIDRRWRRG
jgi:hypothetical protein